MTVTLLIGSVFEFIFPQERSRKQEKTRRPSRKIVGLSFIEWIVLSVRIQPELIIVQ